MTSCPSEPLDALVNNLDIVLEDLDNISDKRCDSVMSVLSTTNSTISPRQRKSSHQRGSQISIETKVRKRSSGPGLATKRAELLSDKRIVPNRNVGSKLKVSLHLLSSKSPCKLCLTLPQCKQTIPWSQLKLQDSIWDHSQISH